MYICKGNLVLVPFYRGAVVFSYVRYIGGSNPCSRPLLSRSGCICDTYLTLFVRCCMFSSPFIEERLYLLLSLWMNFWRYNSSRPLLSRSGCISKISGDAEVYGDAVLVPFYRGAVVFWEWAIQNRRYFVLVPFYRGAVVFISRDLVVVETTKFSSPFIEERLYL